MSVRFQPASLMAIVAIDSMSRILIHFDSNRKKTWAFRKSRTAGGNQGDVTARVTNATFPDNLLTTLSCRASNFLFITAQLLVGNAPVRMAKCTVAQVWQVRWSHAADEACAQQHMTNHIPHLHHDTWPVNQEATRWWKRLTPARSRLIAVSLGISGLSTSSQNFLFPSLNYVKSLSLFSTLSSGCISNESRLATSSCLTRKSRCCIDSWPD